MVDIDEDGMDAFQQVKTRGKGLQERWMAITMRGGEGDLRFWYSSEGGKEGRKE